MAKSILNRTLILLLLLIPGGISLAHGPVASDCAVQLEIQIGQPDALLHKTSIEAIVSGAEKPVYYIFYKGSGELLSKDVTSSKVKNLDPGTYYCSIVDGKGCNKKTEFKIE